MTIFLSISRVRYTPTMTPLTGTRGWAISAKPASITNAQIKLWRRNMPRSMPPLRHGGLTRTQTPHGIADTQKTIALKNNRYRKPGSACCGNTPQCYGKAEMHRRPMQWNRKPRRSLRKLIPEKIPTKVLCGLRGALTPALHRGGRLDHKVVHVTPCDVWCTVSSPQAQPVRYCGPGMQPPGPASNRVFPIQEHRNVNGTDRRTF